MKMYCITDDIDTAIGLKLSGIEIFVSQERDEITNEIEKVLNNQEIGILLVTDKIYEMANNQLEEFREKYKLPLLVRI